MKQNLPGPNWRSAVKPSGPDSWLIGEELLSTLFPPSGRPAGASQTLPQWRSELGALYPHLGPVHPAHSSSAFVSPIFPAIDGAQVDEAETELPDQAKARELIEQSKHDLSESVSNIVRAVPVLGPDTVRVLRLERKLRERMGKED